MLFRACGRRPANDTTLLDGLRIFLLVFQCFLAAIWFPLPVKTQPVALTDMELAIGTPQHGWLPVSLTVGSLHHEFNASNVLNDPFAEFLAAAVWAIDADYSFPVLPPNINQPVVTEDSRCVHLWLEPTWHILPQTPTRLFGTSRHIVSEHPFRIASSGRGSP